MSAIELLGREENHEPAGGAREVSSIIHNRGSSPAPQPSRPRLAGEGRWAHRLLCFCVAVAPLPFGSNSPRPLALLCLSLAIGLACAPLGRLDRRHVCLLLPILAIAAAFVAVLTIQSLPGPWGGDPLWTEAAAALGQPATPILAIVRGQPFFALGNVGACCATVALGITVGSDRHRARTVLMVAAWSGLAYAAYGILGAIGEPTMVLWRERTTYVGAALGPFINRNTAALFFACGATLWSLLLSEALSDGLGPQRGTLGGLDRRTIAVRGIAAATCLLALLMTNSRAGVLFGLVGLVSGPLYLFRTRIRAHLHRPAMPWIAGAGLVAVAASFGGPGQRFQSLGFGDEGRLAVYRAVLALIADHPWFGTGLGTFAAAYPAYRSAAPGMRNVWDKAHSTPLELAAEVGLPLTLLVGIVFAAAFAVLLRGIAVRHRDKIVPLAAATTMAMALGHSAVDFSLQIPGFAIVTMALFGVGLAQSLPTIISARVPATAAETARPWSGSSTGFLTGNDAA